MKRLLVLLVTMTVALSLSAAPVLGADGNLVDNGDFEDGDTGFETEYTYLDPAITGGWTLGPEYMYTVSTDPSLYHSAWTSFGDHTTGDGLMMIVNGTPPSAGDPKLVWGQTTVALECVPTYPETPYTLYAGQDWEVGEVLVKTSEAGVCVQFMLTDEDAIAEGWLITEAHVAVAATDGDIPQTKTGNPIPGRFEVNETLDPGVVETPWYCLDDPDSYVKGGPLVIAAHAVVSRVVAADDCWDEVWQIGDVEVANETTGWLENYADEFNWGDPAGPTTAGPSLAAEAPAFADPFVVGSTPTSQFPYNSNYNRGYATDFDVQWDGALPFGGRLTVSWCPGTSASEKKVLGDAVSATFTATGSTVPGMDWFLDRYPLVEDSVVVDPLPLGTHTVNFQHTEGDGTFWDWIRLEKPCEEVESETGWGGEGEFKGKNWATYITYVPETGCDYGSYMLEFWAGNSYPGSTAYPAQPAILEVQVNGEVLGVPLELEYNPPSAPTPGWMKYSAIWDAGTATDACIEIRDLRLIAYGDDFVIDDISFVRQ